MRGDSGAATPAISCLLPVRDGERWLRAAIDSILAQSFGDFELIVIDDGGADASARIVEEAMRRDPRVRLLRQPARGVVAALNAGLAAARGAFIARMDADDVAVSNRFERQIEVLRARTGIVIIGAKARAIGADDSDDGRAPEVAPPGPRLKIGRSRAARFPPSILSVLHPTIMMRAHELRALGGYRDDFRHVEDYDLYLRAAGIGAIAELQETLLLYRLHGANISLRRLREQERNAAACDLRNVGEARGRRGLPPLSLSRATLNGWIAFRIHRRRRKLGVADRRSLARACRLALRGASRASAAETAHILARCLWYALRPAPS